MELIKKEDINKYFMYIKQQKIIKICCSQYGISITFVRDGLTYYVYTINDLICHVNEIAGQNINIPNYIIKRFEAQLIMNKLIK